MNLNFKDPIWAVIVVALLMLMMWQCEGRKADKLQAELDNQQLAQDTARLQAQIRATAAQVDSIRKERGNDSLKFEASRTRLMQSVDHWKGEARKVRPVVVLMSDSIPVLKAYIAATDSTIEKQDSVIAVQELHLKVQAKLYEMEIGVMGERHIQAMALVETWKSAAVDREKKLKKEQRRKRFFRGAAVVLGATTAVLILAK